MSISNSMQWTILTFEGCWKDADSKLKGGKATKRAQILCRSMERTLEEYGDGDLAYVLISLYIIYNLPAVSFLCSPTPFWQSLSLVVNSNMLEFVANDGWTLSFLCPCDPFGLPEVLSPSKASASESSFTWEHGWWQPSEIFGICILLITSERHALSPWCNRTIRHRLIT